MVSSQVAEEQTGYTRGLGLPFCEMGMAVALLVGPARASAMSEVWGFDPVLIPSVSHRHP